MKICFPAEVNEGLNSKIYNHFGSAPLFLVADLETNEITEEINRDLHHAHGQCNPVAALGGKMIDAVVVGGIGGGALNGLSAAGIRVFKADGETIKSNIARLTTVGLMPMSPAHVCGGHGHGESCSHG